MVYGSVTQIGGRVVLKSEKGCGTTVELWLPVSTDLAKPELDTEPSVARVTNVPLNILAVDDDALVLLNTSAMLEELGHKVVEASTAKQALEIFDRQPFDLVITDQAMPQMTGSQLADAIMALRPDTPIIIATGYAELPPGAEGIFTKLSKPFSEDELARAIGDSRNQQLDGR
jgi:CheY-like chemotaxis protein